MASRIALEGIAMRTAEGTTVAKKPFRRRAMTKLPAARKQEKTLYDLAIKNGWGPQIRLIPGAMTRLKRTPA